MPFCNLLFHFLIFIENCSTSIYITVASTRPCLVADYFSLFSPLPHKSYPSPSLAGATQSPCLSSLFLYNLFSSWWPE